MIDDARLHEWVENEQLGAVQDSTQYRNRLKNTTLSDDYYNGYYNGYVSACLNLARAIAMKEMKLA